MATSSTTTTSAGELVIDSADIIRLILGYLTSVGLHESARTLRQESGIGFPLTALPTPTLPSQIRQGEWGSVAKAIQLYQSPPPSIQEQLILELSEQHLSVAQHLLALVRDDLDQPVLSDKDNNNNNKEGSGDEDGLTKARSLEQKLAAMAADPKKYQGIERLKLLYGSTKTTTATTTTAMAAIKQDRRNQIAKALEESTTPVPLNRLPVLIQQAYKWQSWTGQLPRIKKRKHYDLVMGTAKADKGVIVGEDGGMTNDDWAVPIPSSVLAKVKFGKSAVCEAACFVRNALITGSSDGLIELWDTISYKLNTTDYAFQGDDSVMGHDTAVLALCVSNDQSLLASGDASGIVKLWKLESGSCLRSYQAQSSSITCLDWSPDASRLLVASAEGGCREFGIVSQHVLQEYMGHTSYIHSCRYLTHGKVVTCSADGTVRIWKQGQCHQIFQPPGITPAMVGSSIVVDTTTILTESPGILTIHEIPGSPNQLLIVPRASTAYLIDVIGGTVLQSYSVSAPDAVFCAGTVTVDWVYLCSTAHDCLVFDIPTGRLQTTIREFGVDSTSKTTTTDHQPAEISQLAHHPFKPLLAAFSNDKTQKKGILTVWK